MRRYLLPLLLAAAVAACTPTAGTERVTAGESVDIASAGAQFSVQRAQNGVIRPLGLPGPALSAAAEAHAAISQPNGRLKPHYPPGSGRLLGP